MQEFLPDIQEQLRNSGLPKFRAVQTETETRLFGGEKPLRVTTATHWEFGAKDNRTVATLGTDSISLLTTAYHTIGEFAEGLTKLLETVRTAANVTLRERIGLRYVNVIVPSSGKALSDYIVDKVLGFLLGDLGVKTASSVAVTAGNSSLGTFVMRSIRRPRGSVLPPDLASLKLETNKPLTMDQEFCCLDFDHFNEGTKDFDVAQTMKEFEELHELIERAFNEAVKPAAMEEWK